MSQRDSGYERKERDLYETPEWVTDSLVSFIDVKRYIWEPAAGGGKMVAALEKHNFTVHASDIATGKDFLAERYLPDETVHAIVTNPPYELATEFIEHALELMKPCQGVVAMLLRTDFDHAKTRQHLFSKCPAFWTKLVLTKRIKWFEDSKGQPSFNHAWFIWDWQNSGPPTLAYGPQ